MADCIFCKIINNELPSYKIAETEHCIAFLDINPLNYGHTLIVPKAHYETIFDMDEKLSGEIMQLGWKVANVINKSLEPDGMNLVQCNYKAGNQVVPHFHLHVIPRYKDDNLKLGSWEIVPGEQEKLERVADQLKESL